MSHASSSFMFVAREFAFGASDLAFVTRKKNLFNRGSIEDNVSEEESEEESLLL